MCFVAELQIIDACITVVEITGGLFIEVSISLSLVVENSDVLFIEWTSLVVSLYREL